MIDKTNLITIDSNNQSNIYSTSYHYKAKTTKQQKNKKKKLNIRSS